MQTKPKTFYKAVTTDYRDFATRKIDYSVGNEVVHPDPGEFGEGDASGYLSVATEPTGCIGAGWPLRLLEVEVEKSWQPHKKHGQKDYRNKHAVHSLRVAREIEAWRVFGPQGERIAELADKAEELFTTKASNEELYNKLKEVSDYLTENIYRELYRSKIDDLEGLRGSAWSALPSNDMVDALRILVIADLLDMTDPLYFGLLVSAETGIVLFEKIYEEYKNPPVVTSHKQTLFMKIAVWFKKF